MTLHLPYSLMDAKKRRNLMTGSILITPILHGTVDHVLGKSLLAHLRFNICWNLLWSSVANVQKISSHQPFSRGQPPAVTDAAFAISAYIEIEENREDSAVPCQAASCKQPINDSDIAKFGKADVEPPPP